MARICKIEIGNFRSIQSLCWRPNAGVNCIIGPGDSGKSTVLDAIDLCLGARKLAQFTDDDFYNLDVDKPISISLTLGDLDDDLKNLDTYGLYLRGFNPETGDTTDCCSYESDLFRRLCFGHRKKHKPSKSAGFC